MEGFLAEHIGGRAAERGERRILQHLELELAVAVDEIRVGEEVEPVVNLNVEGAEQAFVFEGAALQHLLRLDFSGGAEKVDEQGAHLPAVAHFFDHDAGKGAAVPVGGGGLEQVALLLDRGKLGVALVDDHVHERVAHLLGGDLAEVLPLAIAFVGSELDLFGFDRAVERVEVEGLDVVFIDADFLAPFVEDADPLAETSDFCYLAWHRSSNS